ncbi:MAG: MBOAT family protein [Saprospiraceae bacterium]|jgi:alginate O-acetyltransferase complex protein AlgI|nr:MBOAT family protein [Saprospiraceae bacterium]
MFQFDPARILDQFLYHPESPLLFSSGLFLFLFLGFLLVYRALQPYERARILWCVLFSTYFYYKSSGIYFLLLVASVIADYHLARWIAAAATQRAKGWLLALSLVANLGMLAYFKYTNYFFELWAGVTGAQPLHFDIFLPVGISFFTFQSLSYTIDVYRGSLKALDDIWDYAFFVTFFPQMVAGPIVRAAEFLPQIHRPLHVSREEFGRGVFLFCVGLFKKAVISDYISLNFVDRVFESPAQYTGLENLFGIYGYALQIYCDFSGYSDMAIGIGLLLGFTFPINFNSPYQSLSITEFWRRWHISLSTWLRDYLYISLGGNRYGRARTYLNLLLTMLLGGLWHGAATRFIIWGGLHGVALAVERAWKEIFPGHPGWWRRFLGGLWTFHFVCFCWIFFRAPDLEAVLAMLGQIAYAFNPQVLPEFLEGYGAVVFWMALGYGLHLLPATWEQVAERRVTGLPLAAKAVLITLVIALVMQVKSSDVQPFIYFQF